MADLRIASIIGSGAGWLKRRGFALVATTGICAALLMSPARITIQMGDDVATIAGPQEAKALFGIGDIVNDPIHTVESVFNGQQIAELLFTQQNAMAVAEAMLDGRGPEGALKSIYPQLAGLIDRNLTGLGLDPSVLNVARAGLYGRDIEQSASREAMRRLRSAGKELARRPAGGVSARLTDVPVSTYGADPDNPANIVWANDEASGAGSAPTPGAAAERLRRHLVPAPGTSNADRIGMQQGRRDLYRATQVECLGLAESQMLSVRSASERIAELQDMLGSAEQDRDQAGISATVLLQILEETVAVQALAACEVRLAASRAMSEDNLVTYENMGMR